LKDKRRVTVVITDLDNTLFDWVDIWYRSFNTMLVQLVKDSGISQGVLESEFKKLHQKYGTSEYAFSIEELPSLQTEHPGEDLAKRYATAIQAFREARKASLNLYPTVLETLKALKDIGCVVVGYTESMAFYTNYRVRKMGLDGPLDYLYSPADHDLPFGLNTEQIRKYPEQHYKLRHTIHRHTPKGELKPNPAVLIDILKDLGASAEQTIYVGDSLIKDVVMAQSASVIDVFAKYGVAKNRSEYDLLRRVTHWPDEIVEKEKSLTEDDVKPQYTLKRSFGELMRIFYFARFAKPRIFLSDNQSELVLDIWKKTIDVQMHFNDLELRIRNYAATILVAVLGVAGFALKESISFSLLGITTSLAVLLLIAGIIGWLAFYFMDRFWYHRLLYGAVTHGIFIEDRIKSIFPEISLTEAIGKASPVTVLGRKIRTPRKIDIFYGTVTVILIVLALITHFTIVSPATKSSDHTKTNVSKPISLSDQAGTSKNENSRSSTTSTKSHGSTGEKEIGATETKTLSR